MLLLIAFLLLYQMKFTWGAYVLVSALWAVRVWFAYIGMQDLKKGMNNGKPTVTNNHTRR